MKKARIAAIALLSWAAVTAWGMFSGREDGKAKAEEAIQRYKEFMDGQDMYALTATKGYPRGGQPGRLCFW